MLGKKLYKTSMIWAFKSAVIALFLFFLRDFYLETITDDRFVQLISKSGGSGKRVIDLITFVTMYPGDLISFVAMFFVPCIYFGFIRGVRFYEKGIVFNRGIPFFNQVLPYSEIKTYKLLHPKLAISIHSKNGDAFVVADERVERAVAILDQHEIKGDLAQDELVKLLNSFKKLLVFSVIVVIVLYVLRKFGVYIFYS